ncbi:MAG: LysR family transcriptional regulator [Gammaproteobacteria bacterium]|nr:LysR family transcriptional regulator [Gammaproteobacteria bacterium]MBU1492309.1 LysR family transcriptional regulator [Gammaproteobacteria bacterium]MBU2066314.1 LysR family transcriptional regulator [Gammaproteobacteria bacterium]MBU2139788.1 LysR family transcriptional regulator [Gammaproteobacteria bacterium]MBU2218262.1 LysR family transcriptional regulator [Gammaproteobacteria bacterium]
MELRHLRYFVAVAEELHFGRAAELLGISQPPLSQQIQALEQELGVRLFERSNRHVALTDAGRLFLEETRQTLAQVSKSVDVVRRAEQGEIGELQIGFTSSAPFVSIIPQAVFAFRQAFPAVHLNLQEMTSREVSQALVDKKLQVGMIRPLELPAELDAVELLREPLVALLHAGHPLAGEQEHGLSLAELAAEPFVFFPRSYGSGLYGQLFSLARQAGFSPRITQEAHEALTIIGLVAAGLGVSVLPSSFRRIRIDGVVFRTLLDADATTAVWLVKRRQERSPLAQAFIDLLTREAQARS